VTPDRLQRPRDCSLSPSGFDFATHTAAALTHSAIDVAPTPNLTEVTGRDGAATGSEGRSAAVLARAEEHLGRTLRIAASVLARFGYEVPRRFQNIVGEPVWSRREDEVSVEEIPEAARRPRAPVV
jgi:hypothetical protein